MRVRSGVCAANTGDAIVTGVRTVTHQATPVRLSMFIILERVSFYFYPSTAGPAWYHRGRRRAGVLNTEYGFYGEFNYKRDGLTATASWSVCTAAICTILTEPNKLVGPGLHFYHHEYIVSQMGQRGDTTRPGGVPTHYSNCAKAPLE